MFIALKLILSKILTVIIEHWRVFLVVAMMLAILFYKSAYEHEKADYAAHIAADKQAMQIRQAENKTKEESHKKAVEKAGEEAKALIAKFELDRNRDAKKLKDLYADKTNADFRLGAYADRLRINQSTAGLLSTESDPSALAEGWRKCDAAYSALENACRITTIDYNELRAWGDSACETVVCK